MTQAMVRKVIDDANKKGELEIRVRRYNAGLFLQIHIWMMFEMMLYMITTLKVKSLTKILQIL